MYLYVIDGRKMLVILSRTFYLCVFVCALILLEGERSTEQYLPGGDCWLKGSALVELADR